MNDHQNFTVIEYHDGNFYDCFRPVFESGAKLSEVRYYVDMEFIGDSSNWIEIIQLIFVDKDTVYPIYLRANPDFDTIEIYDRFPETDTCYQSFIPQTLWNESVGSSLAWCRKMQNQQGYVDGIQFEFHNHTIIQIIGLASELVTMQVVKATEILCKSRIDEHKV